MLKRYTFQVPVSHVKGALIFAGKSDIRYYLNGLAFQRFGDSMVTVGCDGHRCTVLHNPGYDLGGVDSDAGYPVDIPQNFGVIVDRDTLAQAIKAHTSRDISVLCFQVEGEETLSAEGWAGTGKRTVRILANGGAAKIESAEVEGKYPDWQRIIPPASGKPEGETPAFNAEYIADYAKLGKLLSESRHPVPTFRALVRGPNDSIVVDVGQSNALCVVMPMRDSGPAHQEWFYGPQIKPAETPEEFREETRRLKVAA